MSLPTARIPEAPGTGAPGATAGAASAAAPSAIPPAPPGPATSSGYGIAPGARKPTQAKGATDSPERAANPATPTAPMGADELATLTARLTKRICAVVLGKKDEVRTAIATFLAGGHLLIEDVPGVGKTTLALALARCLDLRSARIQFTADLLPADVTGVSIYDQAARTFRFHPGPVFTGILIADEINRATPRTQSALLEAMGEGHVSVEGHARPLPDPFMTVGTQNPLDMEGTFPLPEAQRDRFMTRLSLGYPDPEAETAMVLARGGADPLTSLTPVASEAGARRARSAVAAIKVAKPVARYAVALAAATRDTSELILGASPRAALHLVAMGRAGAAMDGRGFVTPDDIASAAPAVLGHRIAPAGRFASSAHERQAAESVLAGIIARTPAPRS